MRHSIVCRIMSLVSRNTATADHALTTAFASTFASAVSTTAASKCTTAACPTYAGNRSMFAIQWSLAGALTFVLRRMNS